jgi:hypothetical protein
MYDPSFSAEEAIGRCLVDDIFNGTNRPPPVAYLSIANLK